MAEIASDMAFRYSENLDPWELEAWSLMLFPEDDADKASCQQLSKAASERLPSEAQDQVVTAFRCRESMTSTCQYPLEYLAVVGGCHSLAAPHLL